MVVITAVYCNTCKKECDPKNSGSVQGKIEKMTPEAELKQMMFQGDYCEEHFSKLVHFIETFND